VQAINRPIDRVICVSEYGLNCMTSLKVLPRERYQLVYNGVDLARIHPDEKRGKAFRQRFAIPDDRAIVLQVSWIIPEKGIEEVLRTAQIVTAANDKVQFVLAGEGPQRQRYMELAAELGLSDHITWTGLLNDPLDDGVYEAADIIIQLSNWEEVFGWMIAEGMAFGKPVVATRVGGIPELVADGRSGFLIERGDIAQAAEKILALLSDSSLREALGRAGREKTGTSFDLRKNVTLLLNSYGLKPKLPVEDADNH
jgi:glycosyltransferase involved in cell wall biosynthesis